VQLAMQHGAVPVHLRAPLLDEGMKGSICRTRRRTCRRHCPSCLHRLTVLRSAPSSRATCLMPSPRSSQASRLPHDVLSQHR
jgi:hypothetical protein